jgi:hypothetical protein
MEIVPSSAAETVFGLRISTMLPFYYTFLILVLCGSSVAAMPLPDGGESEALQGNKNVHLRAPWGQVKLSETKKAVDGYIGDAQYLDDVIQFEMTSMGVENVTLSRLMRRLTPDEPGTGRTPRKDARYNKYSVVRKNRQSDRPAATLPFLESVPIQTCRSRLHDTYWGLNPILGRVSDNLMIWKSWQHALLSALQGNLKLDWEYIMHIQWKAGPTKDMDVPYVTFTPPDQLRGNVLKAQEYYILDDTDLDYHQEDGKSEVLQGNMDVRLRNTVWGRVILSTTKKTVKTWTDDARGLDDAIRFLGPGLGVEKVEPSRLKRKLLANGPRARRSGERKHNEYSIIRQYRHGDMHAERRVILQPTPIDSKECRYLHDTYWGLNPEILGLVSNSLMIWKS